MKVELHKFKKISENEHSAVMQHPAGHRITIAKKVLSPEMKKQLASLPMHFDEGGDVSDASDSSTDNSSAAPPPVNININANPQPQAGANPIVDMPSYDPQAAKMALLQNPAIGDSVKEKVTKDQGLNLSADQINQALPQGAAHTVGEMPVPETVPAMATNPGMSIPNPTAQQAPADPYGTQAYLNSYGNALREEKGGIYGQAKAEGQLGQAQAGILDSAQRQQQAVLDRATGEQQRLFGERQSFMQDYMNQHIDPQHYLNSMGTGQKISTAIGLILGGIGGGLTHQANPALEFLNKQIENDILAQQANMQKSHNLLSANYQSLGNLRDAVDMTRVMQTDIVKSRLASEAAKTQDPLAKSRAMQAIGQLDMQAAPVMQQMAMRRALQNGMGNSSSEGSGNQMDPATQVRLMQMSGIINPQQAEQANKEIGVLTARNKALTLSQANIQSQAELQKLGSRVGSPLQSSAKLDALNAQLTPLIMDAAPSKRLTPESVHQEIAPFRIGITDDANTQRFKLMKLQQYIMQQSDDTPTLRGLGVQPAQTMPRSYDKKAPNLSGVK